MVRDRSIRPRWGLVIWIGVCLVLTSCSPRLSPGDRQGAATPEEAVRRSALVGIEAAHQVQIHGVRPWDQGSIVLSSSGDPQHAAELLWSYQLVERGAQGWHATTGKGFNQAMFEHHGSVRFRTDSLDVQGRTVVVLFGQVDVPGSMVDVQLMDQQVLRDTATPHLFVLVLPTDVSPQELRVVDLRGQVVERIDISPQLSGDP